MDGNVYLTTDAMPSSLARTAVGKLATMAAYCDTFLVKKIRRLLWLIRSLLECSLRVR